MSDQRLPLAGWVRSVHSESDYLTYGATPAFRLRFLVREMQMHILAYLIMRLKQRVQWIINTRVRSAGVPWLWKIVESNKLENFRRHSFESTMEWIKLFFLDRRVGKFDGRVPQFRQLHRGYSTELKTIKRYLSHFNSIVQRNESRKTS